MSVTIDKITFKLSNGRTIDLTMAEIEALRDQLMRFPPSTWPTIPSVPVCPPTPYTPFEVTCSDKTTKRK